MQTVRAGNPDLIHDLNRTLVLNLVRERAGISRADVARASGLSASAVTGIISELLADGYLVESRGDAPNGRDRSRLGRPATALRVNPSAGCVVGVKVAATSMTAVVADLAGDPMMFLGESRGSGTVDGTVDAIAALVSAVADRAGLAGGKLLGVGVGLPGIVNPEDGVVHASPMVELNRTNIGALLAGAINVPIHVDNDVNTLTIAEHLFGQGRGVQHLAVLSVGRGIGMGLVLNGVLYRGRAGGAGELGHVVVDPGGAACWCGRRGCLETVASEPALVQRVRRETGRNVDVGDLAAEARSQPAVAAVLRDAGRAVGMAVRNVVSVLDPERIVVSGEGVRLGDSYLDAIRAHIIEGGVPDQAVPQVVHEPWGDEAWARGAASLVLGELFRPAHLPQPQELRPSRRRVDRFVPAVPAIPAGGG